MKTGSFKRSSPGRRSPPYQGDAATDLVGHARALHGDDADPRAVAGSLFKAAFLSLARLAPEDGDRRKALLQRVGERAYDELANP